MTVKNQTYQQTQYPAVDQHTRQHHRDFTATTDTTSLILKHLDFPSSRRRNIVCALQGVGNGRNHFECSHINLARRMQHKGSDVAAQQSVYRELKALEDFQHRAGYQLFKITRGGGVEHRRTSYEDFITPAAVWAVQQARLDEGWKTNPGLALRSKIEEAVARLPRLDPAPAPAQRRKHRNGKLTRAALELQLAIHRDRAMQHLRACLELTSATVGPDGSIRFLESLTAELSELMGGVHASDESARQQRKVFSPETELSDLSSPLSSSPSHHSIHKRARYWGGEGGAGELGLQSCSPPLTKPDADPSAAPGMLEAALAFAARGWAVFPLHTPDSGGRCSCRNHSRCTDAGKHPRTRNGVRDATTDPKIIRDWWARCPDANIGLATGAASGIVCLDIDPRHCGDKSLEELIAVYGELPETAQVATGGGGNHFFFTLPEAPFVNSSSAVASGIDVKTTGGYVVAAPSLHASGERYRWVCEAAPAPMPSWLVELLVEKQKSSRKKFVDHTATPIPTTHVTLSPPSSRSIHEGGRNERLYRIGCAMRGRGMEAAEIESELLKVNGLQCCPPLGFDEVLKIARSAAKHAPNAHAARTPRSACGRGSVHGAGMSSTFSNAQAVRG